MLISMNGKLRFLKTEIGDICWFTGWLLLTLVK